MVQRSKGRSAVAASAYRAREKLLDERQGITFDYSKKQDLVHSEIIGFNGTREQLWNLVEFSEKRKDATTAKEYEVAIPRELSPEKQIELVREFAKHLNEKYGVAVDFAIHNDKENKNPHAHILTTTRAVENGNELSKLKVARDWSDAKRKKHGMKGRKIELVEVREKWGLVANKYLELENHNKRIDHRSLADQGSEKIPGIHIGPNVNAMTKKGIETDRQNIADGIKELNNEIVISSELVQEIEIQGSNKFAEFRPVPTFETKPKKKPVIEDKKPEVKTDKLTDRERYYLSPKYDFEGSVISFREQQLKLKFQQDKQLRLSKEKLADVKYILEQQITDTEQFIEQLNTNNLSDYHSLIDRAMNKNFIVKLGFKLGILKVNIEPPRTVKIEEHKPLELAKENLKKAEQQLEEFKQGMIQIEVEPVHQIEHEATPKIEHDYNNIIDVEPQNTTLSEEPTTGFNIEELKMAAERDLKKIEDELTQESKHKPDNSPSPS